MTALDVVTKIRHAGGEILVGGGNLRIKAPGGTLTAVDRAVLAESKADLVRRLSPPNRQPDTTVDWSNPTPEQTLDEWWDSLEEPVSCKDCGSCVAWWDAWGDRHCMRCDPPDKARRLLDQVNRLRSRTR